MKSIFAKIICLALAVAVLLSLCAIGMSAFALYNDERFDAYENMKEKTIAKYTVPTLFKNDAVFTNYKRFPLVVQDDIEYVPIEMFSGMSGVEINTRLSNLNFYIENKTSGAYISFDVQTDLVTTHEFESYLLPTKLFYQTRYVPAREVARVLGINCEIYDSIEDGVYALRFADKRAKLSFSELIKLYSPIKKDPVPPPVITEDPQPPKVDIGTRTIYLSFELSGFGYVRSLIDTLYTNGVKATFFCSADGILENPDTVRKIINQGHSIGLLIDGSNTYESFYRAKEALRLVTKKSTRLVRISGGSTRCTLSDFELASFVDQNGLCLWDYNISVADSQDMYDRTVTALSNLRGTTAILNIRPGANTRGAMAQLAQLVFSDPDLSFALITDTTDSITARNIN